MIVRRQAPRTTRVLPRGNWQDEAGEVVEPGVPHFLPQPANPDGKRLDRLDLARWLTSPENPLTARVFANRLWKQFFGAGLSGGDGGRRGPGGMAVAPRAARLAGRPSSAATGTSRRWSGRS